MRNLLLIVSFFACTVIYAQENTHTNRNTAPEKYRGVQVKMPDSSQVVTTTDPRALKTVFKEMPAAANNSQIIQGSPDAGKNKYIGVKVLPAPSEKDQTNDPKKIRSKPSKDRDPKRPGDKR
jgi:hypothetical protein